MKSLNLELVHEKRQRNSIENHHRVKGSRSGHDSPINPLSHTGYAYFPSGSMISGRTGSGADTEGSSTQSGRQFRNLESQRESESQFIPSEDNIVQYEEFVPFETLNLHDFSMMDPNSFNSTSVSTRKDAQSEEIVDLKKQLQHSEQLNKKLLRMLARQENQTSTSTQTQDNHYESLQLQVSELLNKVDQVFLDHDNYKNHNDQLTNELRTLTDDFVDLNKTNQLYKERLQKTPDEIDLVPIYRLTQSLIGESQDLIENPTYNEVMEVLEVAQGKQKRTQTLVDHMTIDNRRLKEEINTTRDSLRIQTIKYDEALKQLSTYMHRASHTNRSQEPLAQRALRTDNWASELRSISKEISGPGSGYSSTALKRRTSNEGRQKS